MPLESERRARVVVVDRDEDSRETMAIALRLAGFEVEAFASPLEALAAVGRARPDQLVAEVRDLARSGGAG